MAESSIVLELQRLAAEKCNDVCDLLRKSLLVARKLKLDQFTEWIGHEQDGYGDAEVPEYRKLRAQVMLKNPYHGLVPVIITDEKIYSALCDIEVRDPIGGLCAILENGNPNNLVSYTLSPTQTECLYNLQEGPGRLPPIRVLGRNKLASIIDAVRNHILNWACNLERGGILVPQRYLGHGGMQQRSISI